MREPEFKASLENWNVATAQLHWGEQRVFLDTLKLVSEEQIQMAYGTDINKDGNACLVNAARPMLASMVNATNTPAEKYNALVASFDEINYYLWTKGVNPDSQVVSPLAAEILIANFSPLKVPNKNEVSKEALLTQVEGLDFISMYEERENTINIKPN